MMQSQLLPPPLKVVGHVSGKHGFQGNIQVQYLPGFSKTQIKKGNFLFVVINGKGVPFRVLEISKLGDLLRLQFISDELSAKKIIGCDIALPIEELNAKSSRKKSTSNASPIAILGWNISTHDQVLIGEVVEIQEMPQGFILTVKSPTDSYLIPLVDEWITDIDESKKIIAMELPDGLLSINQK